MTRMSNEVDERGVGENGKRKSRRTAKEGRGKVDPSYLSSRHNNYILNRCPQVRPLTSTIQKSKNR